jgi:mRNA-degrading endonuclease RelE of RelBE toxin-antitoxin system
VRARIRSALERLAVELGRGTVPGGKAVKTIRGVSDAFHRLRVGDYRVIYDTIDEDRVVLVLGIVHRRDLERWIRNR